MLPNVLGIVATLCLHKPREFLMLFGPLCEVIHPLPVLPSWPVHCQCILPPTHRYNTPDPNATWWVCLYDAICAVGHTGRPADPLAQTPCLRLCWSCGGGGGGARVTLLWACSEQWMWPWSLLPLGCCARLMNALARASNSILAAVPTHPLSANLGGQGRLYLKKPNQQWSDSARQPRAAATHFCTNAA